MVLLRYDPSDGEPFHDERRHRIYWPGDRDVPDDAVGQYLRHDGWERAVTSEGDSLNVETYLENEYHYLVGEIESGAVDDHLETIRNVEQNRTEATGPRPSVLEAVEERLAEITSDDIDEE